MAVAVIWSLGTFRPQTQVLYSASKGVNSFVGLCFFCGQVDCYGNEKRIRKWTRSVFLYFFNLMGTRMVQIRIAKSV